MENGQYQKAKVSRYVDTVTARLQSIPGVQHAGLGMSLPLGGGGWQVWSRFWVAGEGNSHAGGRGGHSRIGTANTRRR